MFFKFMGKPNLRKLFSPRLIIDIAIITASLYLSLFLRVGESGMPTYLPRLQFWLPVIFATRILSLTYFNCYSMIWRYASPLDAIRIGKAIVLSTLIILAITFLYPDQTPHLPRTVYVIDAILSAFLLMGIRLLRRVHFESRQRRSTPSGMPTLIYGAGQNGRTLAQRFRSDGAMNGQIVGFIDDDPKKQNLEIGGIPILGTRESLSDILERHQIRQLIIAIPSLPGEILREVVQATRPLNIRPRLTPNLIHGPDAHSKNVEIYRDIELRDLLNRPPRHVDLSAVSNMVRGKSVLVTGAGGSIGSELARQIMTHEPSRLLLLDHSEYNLYEIDQQLRLSSNDIQRVVPLMIDLKDQHSLTAALREYSPDIIFHAAAYKHVHLVESNPYSSILNNIAGTQHLLDLAVELNVQTFVMISTDKAVNPAGVMGATKRACELLVTTYALETGRQFCSVRFGNVLGSSGSLIPLLRSQIQEGGPVTITHQDMTRFFMLIPEAVSLVLKAATIAGSGDINILKMGEPVRITEIASSLIALLGKNKEEVPIVFTGLRPGEKMFEELYIRGDELKTEHPDILTLPNGDSTLHHSALDRHDVLNAIRRMIEAARISSKDALFELNRIIKSHCQPVHNEKPDDLHTLADMRRIRIQ
jgi:FlaA1/EpsC-like NDP-sugar epimerase